MSDFEFSFKEIVENANDIIVVTKAFPIDEPGPEIVYVNKAFTDFTGYTSEEVLGKSPRILQSADTSLNAKKKIRNALMRKIPVRVTIKNFSKDGVGYWLDLSILPLKNSLNEVTHFAAIQRDVTKHKKLEEKLETLSKTDSLTGLYNHRGFTRSSKNEYSRYQRSGDVYSVLMLDIDHFKKINDLYGHPFGDTAIQHCASLCENNIRQHDILSRIGGEEFCIVLPNTDYSNAMTLAKKLKAIIESSALSFESEQIAMTVSIGVSEVLGDDSKYTDVIKRADEKLYQAKNNGRNCVR